MQTRILACLAGGFLGVVAASPMSNAFELSPLLAFTAGPIIGIFVGYVASMLIDVFTASSHHG